VTRMSSSKSPLARVLHLRKLMTRILVADDDPSVRSVLQDALQQDGYDVDAVCNGRQALTAIARHRPALMVLDLEMPELDGPSLVRTLRDQTCWGAVPLVLVSAVAEAPAIGQQLGAWACLRKPFDLDVLLSTIEQAAPRE
jgi:CheY-like chemotaxis protein